MLVLGSDINGYRIERLLGRGGMGEVYEATQLALGRKVAFKVLHTRLGQDEDFRERFRREGRLQATLEHPNVVTVYEAGEIEGGMFLAMRMVRGATLKQLIVQGELDAERTLLLLTPVADALDAAHQLGLVHRDVKPQNILIGQDDHPYLADFGLTQGDTDTALTSTGQFLGTIDYVSPEQLRGEPAGPSSDLYALACVLYECLAGTVPFARPTEAAVLYAHAHEDPPSLALDRPDLPAGVDRLMARAMAKEPRDRPRNGSELLAAADEVLGNDPAVASSRPKPVTGTIASGVRPVRGETDEAPVTPATVAGRNRKRSTAGLAAGGAVVLVALAGAGLILGRSGEPEASGEPLSTSASSAGVAVRAPASWRRASASSAPEVPGLNLRESVALTAPEPAAGALAGLSDTAGPRLLPPALIRRADPAPTKPDRVRLGDLEALRYSDVRIRGFDRKLSIYTVPATTGVATVACYAPHVAARSFGPRCDRVAQSLELVRGRGFPLNPSVRTRSAIDSALNALARARRGGRALLARTRKPETQAQAAGNLASAYSRAAVHVTRVDGGPALQPDRDRLAGRLRVTSSAYRDLGRAARGGDSARYSRARRQIRRAEARADTAILALERALQEN